MLFNSVEFAIFFPLVTLGYFLLPHRHRWWWLLGASCGFYMFFKAVYILILFFTIIIDYYAGLLIAQAHGRRRKWYLGLSLVANVGVLAVFKYYNFLNDTISGLYSLLGLGTNPVPYLSILLPIGLSFHTFQAMSYTIEVYRGRQPAERHFGVYALYVMFYPQLVAGPIERPQNIIPQFRVQHAFSYPALVSGLQLMAWGLFQKTVVADRLAVVVDRVYDHHRQYTGLPLVVATGLFAIQIYCDFSGYSDIARGAAETMGFRLMRNFDRPYAARSVSEFWRRWHISLSTWFRDYLYRPLGGNRGSGLRTAATLLLTFLVSGLWHGARWNFLIWGALHGTYLLVGRWTKPRRQRLAAAVGLAPDSWLTHGLEVATTTVLVTVAWVFFRAATLEQATYIIGHMPVGLGAQLAAWPALPALLSDLGLPKTQLLIAAGALGLWVSGQWLRRGGGGRARVAALPGSVRWAAYYALVVALLLGAYATATPEFIYFQF